jgi:peptidoglycan/LPS O-acetylase OafA/YrhL
MLARANRIPSLDGLRAASILLVVFSHELGTRGFLRVETVGPFINLGNLGVRVFFVISGFLITSLLLEEQREFGSIHLGRFYVRRTLRIFPAFYAFVLALIALEAVGWIALNPGDKLHALTYTSNYAPERSWYIGHTWSLAVEEQFYLLWPAILLLAGRRGFNLAIGFVVLAPVIRLAMWQLNPTATSGVGDRFETIADSLAVGCLLANAAGRLAAWRPYRALLESRLFILVPLTVLAANCFGDHPRINLFIAYSVMNVGIALCVHWSLLHPTGRVGRALNYRPVVFIGVLSYSIYLWQQLFLNRYNPALPGFPLNLIPVAGAALLSYYLIERPALRSRSRVERALFGTRTRVAAVAAPVIETVPSVTIQRAPEQL